MEMLTVEQAAKELHLNAQNLRMQIRNDPKMVGFPVVQVGQQIRIPTIGFYNYLTGGQASSMNRKDDTE